MLRPSRVCRLFPGQGVAYHRAGLRNVVILAFSHHTPFHLKWVLTQRGYPPEGVKQGRTERVGEWDGEGERVYGAGWSFDGGV